MDKEPVIEVKPSWGPFSLNLNELWRRWRGRSKGNVNEVAARFLNLFEAHGVAASQIPRFVPSINLSALNTVESLLPSLTPAVLDEVAQFLGIQRAWLENTTDRIYQTHTCYKQPEALFEQLGQLKYETHSCPVRALTSFRWLDMKTDIEQQLALVLVEKLAKVEDVDQIWDIERYHIFCDSWDWTYLPCRIQLKAMVRVIDQIVNERVPLYQVDARQLKAICEGRLVPRQLVNRGLLTNPSLEDYACSLEEHAQAKETEELPCVNEYIKDNDLENVARRVFK
jgi:hypothetical protein